MSAGEGWKAGQKVFEPSYRSWTGSPGRVLTIDRVTKSGRAVIGGAQYDPDGRRRGASGYSRIVPFTDEHRAELELWARRQEAVRLADGIKWRELDADKLDIVIPALRTISGDEPK